MRWYNEIFYKIFCVLYMKTDIVRPSINFNWKQSRALAAETVENRLRAVLRVVNAGWRNKHISKLKLQKHKKLKPENPSFYDITF